MYKVTVNDIVSAHSCIPSLSEHKIENIGIAYQLSKYIKLISTEYEHYRTLLGNLFKVYGKEHENEPGIYTVLPENFEKYQQNINTLLGQTVTIPFDKIDLETFPITDLKILTCIEWMIDG